MGIKQYYSVSEFAEAVGVSKQAIYKQAKNQNSQLAPFVLRKGNSISINGTALVELYGFNNQEATQTNPIKPEQTTNTTQVQPTETTQTTLETNLVKPIEEDYIEHLKTQIQGLQEEQKRLNEVLSEKDRTIKEQSDRIAELAQELSEIAKGALLTTSRQQLLSAVGNGNPEGESEEKTVINTEPIEKQPVSFWKRLFRKK
jgi:DNA-binding phage protein